MKLRKRKCVGCGVSFIHPHHNKNTCSKSCKTLKLQKKRDNPYTDMLESISLGSREQLAMLEPEERIYKALEILNISTGNDYIYFVVAEEVDRVKIGYATNPDRRFRELENYSPVHLNLAAYSPNHGIRTERLLHALFFKDHFKGEWFYLTDELNSVINQNGQKE